MPKFISGRVPVNGPGAAATDRTTFLGLEDAEPNLGLASADNSVITTQTDGTRGISDTPTVTGVNATGIVTPPLQVLSQQSTPRLLTQEVIYMLLLVLLLQLPQQIKLVLQVPSLI